MSRPIALTDPAAREPELVGYKAALLAAAGAEGLPTLPGSVLPLGASEPAIVAGAAALERSGAPAAYLAASSVRAVPDDLEALGADASSVVRSTTALDVDGRWAGAFASYLDVPGDELATAVGGCWASAFTRDALERCDATGVRVQALRVGVLVQPWVRFEVGGTARTADDGRVLVTGASGGPHGVVEGRAGRTTSIEVSTVGPNGSASGVVGAVAGTVASLARRAEEATGIGTIEWGAVDREVALLQIGPCAVRTEIPSAAPRYSPPGSVPSDVLRVASLVPRFPGPLGEELVFPWSLGLSAPPYAEPEKVQEPEVALAEARRLATRLTRQAWAGAADAAAGASSCARLLREGSYGEASDLIRAARAPDPADAARVVALLRGIGVALAERRILPAADVVWQLPVDELEATIRGRAVASRRGADRWEPFVVDAVMAGGRVERGRPVAGGIGAGLLHRLDALRSMGRPRPRAVLLAPLPLPQLAPLLWHCAALVVASGSDGAHLFEVARSLGVPAVVGVGEPGPEGSVVAVDGGSGEVAVLVGPPAPAGDAR